MLPHAPDIPEKFKREILEKMKYDEVLTAVKLENRL